MMENELRLFGMSHQMVETELDRVERALQVDLTRADHGKGQPEDSYYPQFTQQVRGEAAFMARHYELFYCLERSVRQLIREKLTAEVGVNWWDTAVPEPVRQSVEKNIRREIETGITQRSTEPLDYTTFGELGEIVRHNWTTFADTFNNQVAFNKIMTSLNVIRGPIAHSCLLADDEVVRLHLTLRDWFRLMQ